KNREIQRFRSPEELAETKIIREPSPHRQAPCPLRVQLRVRVTKLTPFFQISPGALEGRLELRARAEINSHFAAGLRAAARGAWRRRARIGIVAALDDVRGKHSSGSRKAGVSSTPHAGCVRPRSHGWHVRKSFHLILQT